MIALDKKRPYAGLLKLLASFKFALLGLVGIGGAAILIYSGEWDWAGPVITLSFIVSLILTELVSGLEGPFPRKIEGRLKGLNIPLFILVATVLVYKVIGILTMPDPK